MVHAVELRGISELILGYRVFKISAKNVIIIVRVPSAHILS